MNLTGIWLHQPTGDTFYVLEQGTRLLWLSETPDRRGVHVFSGTRNDQQSTTWSGTWADVPKSVYRRQGRIDVEVVAGDNLVLASSGGDSLWRGPAAVLLRTSRSGVSARWTPEAFADVGARFSVAGECTGHWIDRNDPHCAYYLRQVDRTTVWGLHESGGDGVCELMLGTLAPDARSLSFDYWGLPKEKAGAPGIGAPGFRRSERFTFLHDVAGRPQVLRAPTTPGRRHELIRDDPCPRLARTRDAAAGNRAAVGLVRARVA